MANTISKGNHLVQLKIQETLLMGKTIMENISNNPPIFTFDNESITYQYKAHGKVVGPHFKLSVIDNPEGLPIEIIQEKAQKTFILLNNSFKLITQLIDK